MLRLLRINCKIILHASCIHLLYIIAKYRSRVITRRSRDGQAAKAAQAGSRDYEARRNLRIFIKQKPC